MEVVQNGGSPVITIGFNTMVISDDWMILGYFGVPSGKRLHNELERSTMLFFWENPRTN